MDSRLIVIERAILSDPENPFLVSRLKSLYEQSGFGLAQSIERLAERFGGRLSLLLKLFQCYEDELDQKLSHVRFLGEERSHPGQAPLIRDIAIEYAPLIREQRKALQRSCDPNTPLDFLVMLPGFRSSSLTDRTVPLISALREIDDAHSQSLCRQPIVIALKHITEAEADYALKIFGKFRVDAIIRQLRPMGPANQTNLEENRPSEDGH
ncbi:MAG: hypothetical protein P1V97_09390 [Planctomycetota bacterium]|nr:hypothetical protein [Planctomycetota bacterium]